MSIYRIIDIYNLDGWKAYAVNLDRQMYVIIDVENGKILSSTPRTFQ